jgi:uncharacterized 2Fe-2S/4Fe-4S cluster protein (DUF4445 family)
MADSRVTFLPGKRSAKVARGTTIMAAAAAAGLNLSSPCGGLGRCGKCAVKVKGAVSEPRPPERRLFDEEELSEGWRLACQTTVMGSAEVTVPLSSFLTEHRIAVEGTGREVLVEPNLRKVAFRLQSPSTDDPRADLTRLLDAFGGDVRPPASLSVMTQLPGALREGGFQVTAAAMGDALLAVEPGDTSGDAYGLAVDIGTTTIVAYLCHLPTGEVVATASDLNPQAQYGEDVISRLAMAVSQQDGVEALNRAVIGKLEDLIARVAQAGSVARDRIYEIAVVGNTCMSHLFLGVPPVGLAELPFVPAFGGAQTVRAADLELGIHPNGELYLVPNIGGFVGADTVGVIIASELDQGDGLRVAVDIGTNGEIVVARGGELWACSTAAGPAFEGARISRGMRAVAGAIDSLTIDQDVSYHVIGDTRPEGLCGSGLVDAIAELVRVGVVEESGRIRRREEVGGTLEKVGRRLVENEDGLEFVLASAEESASGRAVSITARDVRELQLAKGALYAGIALLLDEVGARPQDIERLLLAGAFGNYIRRESAVAIGLVPALPLERIVSIGNAAGLGARLALCSISLRRRAEQVAERVTHVHLSEQKEFYDRFTDAMALRPLPEEM